MGYRTLLVATTGGHIDELFDLTPRLDLVGEERLWVTAKTPQTTRVLADEQTQWVPPVGSRQGWRAAALLPSALRLLRSFRPELVVSTGAALAVPYFVAARMMGIEAHYIESATRIEGPSLTGRILARLPGVGVHHQGFRTSPKGWHEIGSVFDAYRPGPAAVTQVSRVVVTFGTERFPFSRALQQVAEALPNGVEALVQTGHTPPHPALPNSRPWIPADELHQAIHDSDVVIMHAGVGSVLTALRAGKHPVILPRLANLGEHVDDHQLELARLLSDRGLATSVGPDDDLAAVIVQASARTTVRADSDCTGLELRGHRSRSLGRR